MDTGFPLTVGLDPASDTGVAGNNRTEAATVTLTGITQANANLTLVATGATTTAAADGSYSFTGVPLALGANTLNVTRDGGYGIPDCVPDSRVQHRPDRGGWLDERSDDHGRPQDTIINMPAYSAMWM